MINTQTPNFIEIRPVGTEFFYADRQIDGETDMAKLIVAFQNYVNAPKKRTKTITYHIAP